MMNSLNLSRQSITTTALFSPKINSSRSKPYIISPVLLRTKSLSPSISASYDAVFPIPNFSKLGLGFFLSLSSNPNSQLPPSQTPNSHPSDAKFFTWHRPTPPESAGGGASGGGRSNVVAVVLGWLGATEKHLRRYAEMYTSRGIDAVTFVVPVKDAMRADLGRTVENRIETLANEIVSWLSNDGGRDKSLIFHTFSTTGWLVYGSILAHMQGKPELIEKIKGCIFDSGGDPELNPKVWASGFGAALLKKRSTRVSPVAEVKPGTGAEKDKPKLQEEDPDILESAVLFGLEVMFTFLFKLPEINQKLSKIITLLSENQPTCPQLYLYSTADKVIRYRSVESYIEHQKMKGKTVRSFNFESSPHVDHFRTFPDVYSSLVNNFVNEILFSGKPT
ncbi:hypothetical protein RND81_02G140200 [Saponaria officinalis]|uniref:Uncharacterized protein n=1 Tax=Saponaria officinalis TaxID=3572 RepID=A0AAW1MU48_SAPOF